MEEKSLAVVACDGKDNMSSFKSFIAILGIWLSCMKVTLKGRHLMENVEIDGGVVMKTGLAMYVWIQMGYTTGACGICSRMTHETNNYKEEIALYR